MPQKTPLVGFSLRVLSVGLDGDGFRCPSCVQITVLYCPPGPFPASEGAGWNCDSAKPDINEDRDSDKKENDLERKPKEITISRRLLNLH